MTKNIQNVSKAKSNPNMVVSRYLNSGFEVMKTEWAVEKFDHLFLPGVLTSKSHDFCRDRIKQKYRMPDLISEESPELIYERELNFIKKVPAFAQKALVDCLKYRLQNGVEGIVPIMKDKRARQEFIRKLDDLTAELPPFEVITNSAEKLSMVSAEHIFRSSIYLDSMKHLMFQLFDHKKKALLRKYWNDGEQKEFLKDYSDFRVIGLYLVLAEYFKFAETIKNSSTKKLPYLHGPTIKLIEKNCDWRAGKIRDDLDRIFNHLDERNTK